MSILDRILGLMDPAEAADRFTPDLKGVPESAMASAREQATVGISPQVQEDVVASTLAHTSPTDTMGMTGTPAGARLASAGHFDQARGQQIGDTLRTLRMESEEVRRQGQQRLEGYQIERQQVADREETMRTQMEAQTEFGNRMARRSAIGGALSTITGLGLEFFGPQPTSPMEQMTEFYDAQNARSRLPQNQRGWPGNIQLPGVRGTTGNEWMEDAFDPGTGFFT